MHIYKPPLHLLHFIKFLWYILVVMQKNYFVHNILSTAAVSCFPSFIWFTSYILFFFTHLFNITVARTVGWSLRGSYQIPKGSCACVKTCSRKHLQSPECWGSQDTLQLTGFNFTWSLLSLHQSFLSAFSAPFPPSPLLPLSLPAPSYVSPTWRPLAWVPRPSASLSLVCLPGIPELPSMFLWQWEIQRLISLCQLRLSLCQLMKIWLASRCQECPES